MVSIFLAMGATAQNHQYYLRAVNANFSPELTKQGATLLYSGKDIALASLFSNNNFYVFEKGFSSSQRSTLQRVFYVETDVANLQQVLTNLNIVDFDTVRYLGTEKEELLDYYPNDYGQTGGANLGLNVNNHAFDFIGAPQAWDYTTGKSTIKLGISDGGPLEITDPDFAGKSEILPNGSNSYPAHGNSVAGIAAARGDNAYGSTGVCYDCNIVMNGYGSYDRILELSYAGARVINCSWGIYRNNPVPEQQEAIDEATENGSIIVAAAHNESWEVTQGQWYSYPASYNNVISVSSVGSRYEQPIDSVFQAGQYWWGKNIQHHVGFAVRYDQDPNSLPGATYIIPTNSTNTLNDSVDILAPSYRVFRYGGHLIEGGPGWYRDNFVTSRATPVVTGAIGLMKSINECMTFKEVESVLKITSYNIDHIPANQFAAGKYGSGSLHVGRAAELTLALMSWNKIAYLENQKFSRWDFEFNALSENVVIRNQEFTDKATLKITAKNAITLENGTLIDPGNQSLDVGFALLEIDPNLALVLSCPMAAAPPTLGVEDESNENLYKVFPTFVDTEMKVVNVISKDVIIRTVKIYDLFNQEIQMKSNIDTSEISIEVSNIPAGIYILKGYNAMNEEVITTKFVKK